MTLPGEPRGELSGARYRAALVALLILAALLRLAHWAAVRDAPFVASLAMDSAEYDRWAREIAAGGWWGSAPFFQAPLYPYLLASIYAVAGRWLDLVYLAQIGAGVAGLALLAAATRRMLGPRHALAAAGLGAIYLPFLFHEVQLTKESVAVPLASGLLLALAVARERQSRTAWLAAGATLGLLVLLRENALLVTPFLLPLCFRRREPGGSAVRAAAFILGLALPLLPVVARNAALGGGFLPTTFQGGVNFWIGNNPGADGTYRPVTSGRQIPRLERLEAQRVAEREVGRKLTGAEVSRYWLDRSLTWAAAEPGAFARLQLRKLKLFLSPYEWPDAVDYYWLKTLSPLLALPGLEWGGLVPLAALGLVAGRRRWRSMAPVLLSIVGWIAATVVFFLFARYRLPVAPALLVLAALPLVTTVESLAAGRRLLGVAGALAFAAALLLPWWAQPAPRLDLVEFNLGRLAEEAGQPAAAREHYQAALAVDPDAFLPTMNLGTLAARARDYAEARRRYERAVALAPDSADARANFGSALLALGDFAGARRELDAALALDAGHVAALGNRELLERVEAGPAGPAPAPADGSGGRFWNTPARTPDEP